MGRAACTQGGWSEGQALLRGQPPVHPYLGLLPGAPACLSSSWRDPGGSEAASCQVRPFSDRQLTFPKGSFLPLPQEKEEGKQKYSENEENPRYIFHSFIKQIFTEHLLFAMHHSSHEEHSSEQDRFLELTLKS